MPESASRSPAVRSGHFMTTSVGLVRRIAEGGPRDAAEAWSDFCRRYVRPLVVFAILKERVPRQDAEDLVNSFFCYLFEESRLHRFDPEKGRFRTYLLTVFSRFGKDERKKARALKRGGQVVTVGNVEDRVEQYIARGLDPASAYAREWAFTAVHEAVDACERELSEYGVPLEREWFLARYAQPLRESSSPPSREKIAKFLNVTPGRASALDRRGKSALRRHLEEQVRMDLSDPETDHAATRVIVREGLQELLDALAG